MIGFLNIHKPRGVTSRDVVSSLQRLHRGVKFGHAGTLDPLASGVLVVAVGGATRLIRYAQDLPKVYRAEFRLGCSSAGDDLEGDVMEHPELPQPTISALREALPRFIGEVMQIPPEFSAVKVDGKRAYELARKGNKVELKPRPVRIDHIDLLSYQYPHLAMRVRCGSGTYIRSLGRDLANAVETKAVMTALVREAIGRFELADALEFPFPDDVRLEAHLQSPLSVLGSFTKVTVGDVEIKELVHGRTCRVREPITGESVAVIDRAGRLIALADVNRSDPSCLQPRILFQQPAR